MLSLFYRLFTTVFSDFCADRIPPLCALALIVLPPVYIYTSLHVHATATPRHTQPHAHLSKEYNNTVIHTTQGQWPQNQQKCTHVPSCKREAWQHSPRASSAARGGHTARDAPIMRCGYGSPLAPQKRPRVNSAPRPTACKTAAPRWKMKMYTPHADPARHRTGWS